MSPPDPMRTLFVGRDWFPNSAGGLDRYFHGAVHRLPGTGLGGEAVVSVLRAGQTAPLPLHGMTGEGARLSRRLLGARRAARAVLSRGVDVANAHFALYAFPWLDLLPARTPLVVHFQGPWADELALQERGRSLPLRVALARRIERRVYGRADRVITLSGAFRDLARDRYGIPGDRIRVVPGGVDTAPFLAAPERRTARERLDWPEDRPILLTVRRLEPRMGLEMLLDALVEVRRACPRVLLLIGGAGSLAERLRARIVERDLADNARLLGFVAEEELPLAYAAADLTLVPSTALEGFGLVTVEALASGTPVLGTPVGGTPEVLRGLSPELIFEGATAPALTARLEAALKGEVALPDRDACRTYAERFSWETVATRVRGIFDEATSRRASARAHADRPRLVEVREPSAHGLSRSDP